MPWCFLKVEFLLKTDSGFVLMPGNEQWVKSTPKPAWKKKVLF